MCGGGYPSTSQVGPHSPGLPKSHGPTCEVERLSKPSLNRGYSQIKAVIPAHAGIYNQPQKDVRGTGIPLRFWFGAVWIPACAGMTGVFFVIRDTFCLDLRRISLERAERRAGARHATPLRL